MNEILIAFIIIIISLIIYLNKKSNNKIKNLEKLSICSFIQKPLKILKEEDHVTCFLCLKNKDFLAGQMNGLISVYNHVNFSLIALIIEHCEPITSLSELNDNTILTSSADGTLRKIRLLINNDNNKRKKNYIVEFVFYTNEIFILKGLQINKSDDILSCNLAKELTLWKKTTDKNELDLYKVNKILLKEEFVYDIMQVNEKLFITSGDSLRCWDVKKYESIKKFNYGSRSNSLYKINDDLIGIFLKKLTDILIFNTKDLTDIKVINISNNIVTSLKSLSNATILIGLFEEENKKSYINQYILNIDKKMEEKGEKEEIIDYKKLELIKIKTEQINCSEGDPYFEEFNWARISVMEEIDNLIILGVGGEEKLKNMGKLIIYEKNEI